MDPARRRLAYYVPIEEVRARGMSLVDHARAKMLYHELSSIYELAIGRDTAQEVQFLRDVVPADQGTVVDLGCGVGRHIGGLAEIGYDGIGLDLSAHAISHARQRWPLCRFVVQDFRDADVGAPAGAAICMWSTFNYLSTKLDIERFRSSLRAMMAPRSTLVIDLPNPAGLKIGPYVRRRENAQFAVEVAIEKRLVGDIAEGLYQYRITDKANGAVYLATDQELNKAYSAPEVEGVLSPEFALASAYGDYDGRALSSTAVSPRMILVFRRAQ